MACAVLPRPISSARMEPPTACLASMSMKLMPTTWYGFRYWEAPPHAAAICEPPAAHSDRAQGLGLGFRAIELLLGMPPGQTADPGPELTALRVYGLCFRV